MENDEPQGCRQCGGPLKTSTCIMCDYIYRWCPLCKLPMSKADQFHSDEKKVVERIVDE